MPPFLFEMVQELKGLDTLSLSGLKASPSHSRIRALPCLAGKHRGLD